MIEEAEQIALDIDWFLTNGKEVGFVASAGGKLPESIAKLDLEIVNSIASYFRYLQDISDIKINPELNYLIGNRKIDDRYFGDFKLMAKKGLYTFDKTVLGDFIHTQYHSVITPLKPLKIEDLPAGIADHLTKVTGDLNSTFYI